MICNGCGKPTGDNTKVCNPCYENALEKVASCSSLMHFGVVFMCIFYFKFKEAFVSFLFCIWRLTKTGPYAKDGRFDELKINWRKKD